jgi:hypothetical protein
MTSEAERREEWKNRQNKGNNNEAWVKAIENGKAIIKGEELWEYSKTGAHHDLNRKAEGQDREYIESKSNNGNLSKPQREFRDKDPDNYKLVRTRDGTNPIHEANELVRKFKKKL